MRAFGQLACSGRVAASYLLAALLCQFLIAHVDAQTQSSLSIDVKTSKDNSSPNTAITTAAFSTTSSKELLLAFISSDASNSSPNTSVSSVSGAGLVWELVQRTNVQLGTSEIWRAFALTKLSNMKVTATLSESVDSSMTVVSFIGADPSGINGSGAIGAVGSGNSPGGAPTASLVTTHNNSWIFGVGNDWDHATSRTLGPNQSLVHQYLAPVNDTYWVQSETAVTPQSGTTVRVNDTAPTTDRYNLSLVEVLPAQTPEPNGPLSLDSQVSSDKSTASKTNTTPAFSTSAANELLLAFISTDSKTSPNTTVTGITGGGLRWQLVQRTNVQLGTAEIWRAFATTQLSNATVTVTLSQSVASSVTVLSFLGADPSGTNGSGAIGVVGTGNANAGAPTVSLTTTRNYSWVFGVGNDWNNAVSRTLGPNQTSVHQYLATVNDTYWVQAQQSPTATSGAAVNINDTEPTGDSYNLSIVEVLPAVTGNPLQVTATASPTPNANGWNNTNVTVTFQCSGGIAPVQCPSPITVATEGTNQSISGIATDAAGNSAKASVTVSIDLTLPTITATASPAPTSNGVNTTPVTVTFVCSDALSGISQCPSPTIVNTSGAYQIVTGQAVDKAGNTMSTSVTLDIQLNPLVVSAVASPSPNAAGWNNTNVTVTFHCSGGSAPLQCPQPQTISSDGRGQIVNATAFDSVGYSASVSSSINFDHTPPMLNVTSPPNGSNVGTSQVAVHGLVTDALSGVSGVTCNGAAATLTASAFTCNVTLTPGSNAITVATTDVAGNSSNFNLTFVYTIPINVQIASPTPLQLSSSNPITVTGTVSNPNASVTVGGTSATVSNGTFIATGVILREGKNLLTASASSTDGGVGSDTVTVYLDTTPPVVHIDNPAAGAVVTSSQIDVTGNVNDFVTGTVNGDQVSVKVNGITATVSNRSFAAHGVLLVPGSNTITATATDRAGNTSQNQVKVILQSLSGQTLSIVSGNAQSASIGTVLPQPLVVLATDAVGRPIPGVTLTFAVAKSDGLLLAGQQSGRQLIIKTGTNGQASVQFQLGSRVGAGANQVSVSAPGFVGQAVFTADSLIGPANQIRVVSGEVQTGAIGVALPEPLVAIVFDSGGNPVAGVPVTFTVTSGGGLIGGAITFTQSTDSDGKAYATLVLGQQEGINNNVVTATFSGMTGLPATFTGSAVVPGPIASTTLTGIVLDNAEQPIPNATASIRNTNLSALTNAQGQFTIAGVPVGDLVLYVDGSTSTSPYTFPTLSFQIATIAGINNNLGHPIYLPPIDTNNSQVVGGDQPVQLTMTGVPGLVYTVAPNSATFPDGTHVGRVTLSQVHSDRVPMTPPNGTAPRLVGTLQPAGIVFSPPIQIQLPNTDGLAPGQVEEIFSFHHDVEQFVVEGTARVSEDGSVVVSDPGFGLTVSGWHGGGGGAPQPPTCGDGCDDGDKCTDDSCNGSACVHTPTQATVQITDPPDNPNPDDTNYQNNFSFLSTTVITANATLQNGGDPTQIQWTVTPNTGGISNPTPANMLGTSFTFTPNPPPHPPYGSAGSLSRSTSLLYAIKGVFCSSNDTHTIKQDERDTIIQEYLNHGIMQPTRDAFVTATASTYFSQSVINQTAYDIILGNPGSLADNIFVSYNAAVNGDQQVQTPGTAGLKATDPVVTASSTSYSLIGRKLVTPPCYPNPRSSCDDVISPDGLSVLAGKDGIAQTTVINGTHNLILNSTWRNPERNEYVKGVLNSRHQFGNAVDMSPSDGRVGLAQQSDLYCMLKTAAGPPISSLSQTELKSAPGKSAACNLAGINHAHAQIN